MLHMDVPLVGFWWSKILATAVTDLQRLNSQCKKAVRRPPVSLLVNFRQSRTFQSAILAQDQSNRYQQV